MNENKQWIVLYNKKPYISFHIITFPVKTNIINALYINTEIIQ